MTHALGHQNGVQQFSWMSCVPILMSMVCALIKWLSECISVKNYFNVKYSVWVGILGSFHIRLRNKLNLRDMWKLTKDQIWVPKLRRHLFYPMNAHYWSSDVRYENGGEVLLSVMIYIIVYNLMWQVIIGERCRRGVAKYCGTHTTLKL